MNKYQKLLSTIVILLFIVMAGGIVSADGPVPPPYLMIDLKNMSKDVKYVDVMIQLPLQGDKYVHCNQSILSRGLSDTCGLVQYHENGFVSYAAHYSGANDISIVRSWPDDKVDLWKSHSYAGYKIMKAEFSLIKIALIDDQGNILSLSPQVNINLFRDYFTGTMTYDMRDNQIDISTAKASISLVYWFLGLVSVPLFVTVMIETLAGLIFSIKPILVVPVTNVVSNLLLNIILFITLYINNTHIIPLIILLSCELAVIFIEFLVFSRFCRKISKGKLLLFSTVANIMSFMTYIFIEQAFRYLSIYYF